MQVKIGNNCAVVVTTSIEVNLVVFFESVDVVKHEKRLRCEDANAFPAFPVDHVKPGELVRIPVEPVHNTRLKEPVCQNSPHIPHERCFGNYQMILRDAEAVHITKPTCWWNGTKNFTSFKRTLVRFSRGWWYLNDVVRGVSAVCDGNVNN